MRQLAGGRMGSLRFSGQVREDASKGLRVWKLGLNLALRMNVLKLASSVGVRRGDRLSGGVAAPVFSPVGLLNSLRELANARPRLAIILLNLVLLASGSWLLPLVDRDEPRFAEASREMLARGDWAVPWFNGQYRFDKPPLIYWCQMLCYRVLGEGAFAARLPGIVFATGTALLLFYWGRRLGGDGLGKRAALFFSTCAGMLIYGRLAFADMPMIFFVTLSVWSGWELTRPEAKATKVWWWLFCLGLGLGFLAKGPVAWLPLAGLFAARLAMPEEFLWPARRIGGALAAALAMVALWGVPALEATQGEYLRVGLGYHVLYRSFHALDGHGGSSLGSWLAGAFFFIPVIILGFFPWSLWFPRVLHQLKSNSGRRDALGNYLLIQGLLVLAVFTLVRTKLPHYILPAFPCLALWLARQTLALSNPKMTRAMFQWATRMAVFTLLMTSCGFLLARPAFVAKSLFNQCHPWLKPEMRFGTVDYSEPSLVWEFRSILTNHLQILTPQEAVNFVSLPGPFVLLGPAKFGQGKFESIATNGCVLAGVQGYDLPHGKKLELNALIRPK